MAIKLENKGAIIAPDQQYPFGDIKDATLNTAGTPVNRVVYGDIHQFFEKLMSYADIAQNESRENEFNSFQFLDALFEVIQKRLSVVTGFTIGSTPEDNEFTGVTYFGKWWAVSVDGTNRAMSSVDGVNWQIETVPVDGYNGAVSGRDILVLTTLTACYKSVDGVNFTSIASPVPSVLFNSVEFVNGLFFLFPFSETGTLYTSTDVENWTTLSIPVGEISRTIAYSRNLNLYVLTTSSGKLYTSADLSTWTERFPPRVGSAIAYGNGYFVMVSGSSGFITYSNDGINWTDQAIVNPANIYEDISYGAGKFIIIARTGSVTSRAAFASDPTSWTALTTVANQWKKIHYNNGRFVAVSNSGTNNRAMTSE